MRLPRDIINYGPNALLINWEQRIDPDINASVHAYAARLPDHPAVLECVPAYCSLMVVFDPARVKQYTLQEWIYAQNVQLLTIKNPVLHKIPVVYGGEFGPDLEEVAQLTGLATKQVIELHTSVTYRVYQLGYQPGFPFLGLTNDKLAVNRKDNPRARLAAGSVGLAGRQTGIYPRSSPGGWQIIGRCPWGIWRNAGKTNARFKAGDEVKFYEIPASEWEKEIKQAKKDGWPIS